MVRALLVVALLAGCGGTATTERGDAPEAASFNLANVKANFAEECESPIVVDELFCDQVEIEGMSSDGDTLMVPTTLNASAVDRARAICHQLVTIHFDGDGVDLGYEFVGVLDRDGGNAAACSV